MGFFDLNIPYDDASKPTRTKLLIKLLELGYTALAYNHNIKGVMSDRDRCSIPLLPLSSLFNHIPPSLLSSIRLHRDALHVPHSSPFRQYTRLTVCVDSPAQCHVINSRNPILKTYDLISVKPLTQIAFDHACEKCEVDIIAIDFSDKLPFRLKPQMVKAAVERGVYFEITYSCLIADVHVRRQMISNAKLLVDWTRGKNLIFSSATLSVNELRGPCDVANLSSLLGLSMERAKAAISKNCRNLITNALRRRHFYKEAIRVEEISSEEKNAYDKTLSADWLKWDPLSSGEGDLQLEDLAKAFADASKVSKPVKAIDFSSIIESIPLQAKSIFSAIGTTEAPVTTFGFSKNPVQPGLPHSNRNSLCSAPSMNQNPVHGSSPELQLRIDRHANLQDPDVILGVKDAIGKDIAEMNMKDEDISITENTSAEKVRTLPHSDDKEIRDISSVVNDQTEDKMIIEKQEHVHDDTVANHNPFSVTTDALKVKVPSLKNNASLGKILMEKRRNVGAGGDDGNFLVLDNDLHMNSSSADCMTTEMETVNVQKHEGAISKSGHSVIFSPESGNTRSKRRASRHTFAFPGRRLLYPLPFKRKAKKEKGRLKMGFGNDFVSS